MSVTNEVVDRFLENRQEASTAGNSEEPSTGPPPQVYWDPPDGGDPSDEIESLTNIIKRLRTERNELLRLDAPGRGELEKQILELKEQLLTLKKHRIDRGY